MLATEKDDKFLDMIYKKIGNKIPVKTLESNPSKPQQKKEKKRAVESKPVKQQEQEISCVGFGEEDDIPAFLR